MVATASWSGPSCSPLAQMHIFSICFLIFGRRKTGAREKRNSEKSAWNLRGEYERLRSDKMGDDLHERGGGDAVNHHGIESKIGGE